MAGLKIHATQEGELAGSVHSLLVIVVVCALIISTIILLSPGNFLIIINVCNWVLGVARGWQIELTTTHKRNLLVVLIALPVIVVVCTHIITTIILLSPGIPTKVC